MARMCALMVVVMVGMLCAGAAAQSSCTNVLVSLSPCLNYIQGNSSTPSSSCCSQLSSVVRSQPQCLCQVLSGGGSSLGININQTQALALPSACKVQTPPTSQCKAASPAGSPDADSPNSAPSGTGSKDVPSPDNGSSHGNSIQLSIPLVFIASAAAYASAFRTY
ncbi:non-specific lipid transfer protein GPI-anchored 5-like [Prosopis cineraria]|uniref:non-specific lipid transfer protein GPI-anchored 5-like n=1 Tax=Prosopis cineraria TaxID=364024 RepID=UPI00240FAB05|nr:non-specific lipid transfer protein GPI-anchored 5-like isoform X1 [Prosopis cineraria]XP_054806873.1 non-specific lipid transfer protein GPI-anchored 5-like [Prosopis cineraria]